MNPHSTDWFYLSFFLNIFRFVYRNAFLLMKLSNLPSFRSIRALIVLQSTFENKMINSSFFCCWYFGNRPVFVIGALFILDNNLFKCEDEQFRWNCFKNEHPLNLKISVALLIGCNPGGTPIGKSYGYVLCTAFMTHLFTLISSSDDPTFKSICSSGAPTLNLRPKSSKVAQIGLKTAKIARWHVKVPETNFPPFSVPMTLLFRP